MKATNTKAELVSATAGSVQPPCQAACPIYQDARGYLAFIAQGRFNQALKLIRGVNPLPSICGTICAHPCETKCRRGQVDEPLSIRALKRFAVEYGGDTALPFAVETRHREKVAIIGSGPAGLTAAYDLALKGYPVTIFEREGKPGGVPATIIPRYRLPSEVIQQDIDAILSLGVELQTHKELGKNFSLDDLERQGYQAILLSPGLPVSRGLRIPGAEANGVLLALPFLKAVNEGEKPIEPGKTVIVIGGGNVAIDVARSARRLGTKAVRLVCLESRKEMPAFPWEIEEAIEEGIEVGNCGWGPKRIVAENGSVAGLECIQCASVFDAQGRFNPTYCEDITTFVAGDTILFAIGQGAELTFLKDMGVKLTERGQLVIDPDTLATSRPGVFACGEVVTGPGTAVQSMASGRKAALSIDRYLRKENLRGGDFQPPVLANLLDTTIENIKRQPRQKVPVLSVEKRITNVRQIELGYTEQLAIQESRRCLSCGLGAELVREKCSICLTCVRVCPYHVPVVTAPGTVDIRTEQCQSCGICPGECPAKAISFGMPLVTDMASRIERALEKLTPAHPRILVFYCHYGVHNPTSFNKSASSHHYHVELIDVPCLSKIDINHLLQAFELGAEGVLIAGCGAEDCLYSQGLAWLKRRVESTQKILADTGLGKERLEVLSEPLSDFSQFDRLLTDFTTRMRGMRQSLLNK